MKKRKKKKIDNEGDQIRNLIAKNKLKEAINKISNLTKSQCKNSYKNAIVISFSIHFLHNSETSGIINFEEHNKIATQIVIRMLNLLEDLGL